MRRAARTDANQQEIVDALRKAGASVAITSSIGDGFPDLVVGYCGVTWLVEVKDGAKSASEQRLTQDQIKFHADFRGAISVINSVAAALELLETIRSNAALPPNR